MIRDGEHGKGNVSDEKAHMASTESKITNLNCFTHSWLNFWPYKETTNIFFVTTIISPSVLAVQE